MYMMRYRKRSAPNTLPWRVYGPTVQMEGSPSTSLEEGATDGRMAFGA